MDRNAAHLRIEREYQRRGDTMGWRLLYSPWRTVETATVAFIGLNPGSSRNDAEHSVLSCEAGSAYEIESWGGYPPGEAPLQRQVQAVFRRARVECKDVLAGNLIPFRSASVQRLSDAQGASSFGTALWRDLLAQSRVRLVIAMGRDAQKALLAAYCLAEIVETRPSGWGQQRVHRARSADVTIIGVPHLSRFRIMTRPQSQAALDWAFDDS